MTDAIRQQIELLEAFIARKEREAARLQRDIAQTERELAAFQAEYDRRITPRERKLDAVKAAIKDLEDDIARQHWTISPLESSGSSLPSDYVPVEEQYRRVWSGQENRTFTPKSRRRRVEEPAPAPRPEPPDRTAPAASAAPPPATLKQLYRQLARRFHPDLARDDAERERRTEAMTLINAAYASGDRRALEAMALHADAVDAGTPLAVLRLEQLHQAADALTRQVEMLEAERAALDASDLMALKRDVRQAKLQGRDILGDLAGRLDAEYRQAMNRLDDLRRQL